MTIYNVHKTKLNSSSINIDENQIDQSTDITLFGRKKLKYGTQLNENLLHILEHFACPENTTTPGTPDFANIAADQTSGNKFLSNPINGQLWYNSTQECLFFYNADAFRWEAVGMQDDIAANWGIIYNGEQIPRPVSALTGRVFDYDECSWIVSPYQFPDVLSYMLCNTSADAEVTSIYSVDGDPTIYESFATYLIVGITGNINLGAGVGMTPTATPVVTTSLTVSSTPVPTPTPTPLPVYVGPLSGIAFNPMAYNDTFAGEVDGWSDADTKDITNPSINAANRHAIFFSPTAPHNPWVPNGIDSKYYVYVAMSKDGGGGGYPYTTGTKNKYIFVSNDGKNGLFYKAKSMNLLGGSMLQIELDVDGDFYTTYYNKIPKQTSNINQLQFSNYGFVYEVESSDGITTVEQDPFYFTCPTPQQQKFYLSISGGVPPYTITNLTFIGGNIPVSLTASGITNENFAATPINFNLVSSNTSKYTGVISTSNPNVSLVSNGYQIADFLTADIHYPINYETIYSLSGGTCKAESFWNYVGNPACTNYTGTNTNIIKGSISIEVTDSIGTVVNIPLEAKWAMQTIDIKPVDNDIGLTASIIGIDKTTIASSGGSYGVPAGEVSSVVGTYVYNVEIGVINRITAIYPTVNLSNLKYTFSMLKPADSTTRGNWLHNEVLPNTNLATLNTGLCYNENDALVHVGDDTTFSGETPLIPFDGSTGSVQEIEIIQYVDNDGIQRNISGTPIIVRFYPNNIANIYQWNSLKIDGTNNTGNTFSPDVPYNMNLDVTIPVGLPTTGSLKIPFIVLGTQFSAGTHCDGTGTTGGMYMIEINFTNL